MAQAQPSFVEKKFSPIGAIAIEIWPIMSLKGQFLNKKPQVYKGSWKIAHNLEITAPNQLRFRLVLNVEMAHF